MEIYEVPRELDASIPCPFTYEALEALGLEVLALDVPANEIGTQPSVLGNLEKPTCGSFDLGFRLRRRLGQQRPGHALIGTAGDRWLPIAGTSALEAADWNGVRVTVVAGDDDAMLLAGLHQGLMTPPEPNRILAKAALVEIKNAEVRLLQESDIPQLQIANHLQDLKLLGPSWVQSAPQIRHRGRSQPAITRRAHNDMDNLGAEGMIARDRALFDGKVPKGMTSKQKKAFREIQELSANKILTNADFTRRWPEYFVEDSPPIKKIGRFCPNHGERVAVYKGNLPSTLTG